MRPGQVPTALRRCAANIAIFTAVAVALALPSARGVAASAVWNAGPWPLASLPVARQSQPTSCGPAALATLATWLGSARTETELLALTELGEGGISLSEFARLADVVGLGGSWYRASRQQLAALPTPFVAHLEVGAAGPSLGHLVVVASVGHGYLVVGDPAAGAYVGSVAAFARRFSGRVFLVGGAA